MAEQTKYTSVSQLGEFGLIDKLTKDFAIVNASTV